MPFRIIGVVTGMNATNCYVLMAPQREDCLVIDPGDDADLIREAAEGRRIAAILLTHGHFDHIGGVRELAEEGTEILIHEADAAMLTDPRLNAGWLAGLEVTAPPATRTFRGGESLHLAGVVLQVLHTPGHTPGSCCFLAEDGEVLFSGDTVMAGGVGRTDLPGGSEEQMRISLRMIRPYLNKCMVLGGHGA